MKQSPQAYNKLFASICKGYDLTQLKADECVFVKFVNNSKNYTGVKTDGATSIHAIQHMQPTLPKSDRIWPDCPYSKAVIIVCTYVDDNLFFTNSTLLAKDFETFSRYHMRRTSQLVSGGEMRSRRSDSSSHSSPRSVHRQASQEMGHDGMQTTYVSISFKGR